MTDERRYGEDEVQEIFELAAQASASSREALSTGQGMTLAELKEIGLEVGLPPDRVVEAAAAMDVRRGAAPRGRNIGMPVSVGRTVDLPREPSQREWEMLVAELRETFQARGRVSDQAGLRHWSNGNLFASVEPTESGHRLRLGTKKANAIAMNTMGIATLSVGLIMLVVFAVTGQLAGEGLIVPVMMSAMGGAALMSGALTLPRWANEREAQMEHIAARARALLGSGDQDSDTAAE